MIRLFPGLSESHILGYYSGAELLEVARVVVENIDAMDYCGDILPRFKDVCNDSERFLDGLAFDIHQGQIFEGRCQYLGLNSFYDSPIPPPANWYAKKTVSGWHLVAAYNLGHFTGKRYYEGKYVIYLGTQAVRYNKGTGYLSDIKEQLIQQLLPQFSIYPSLEYFAALFDGRLDGPLDAPISSYLGGVSYIKINDRATLPSIRLKFHSVEEITENLCRLQPLESGLIDNYDLYKDCCDLLGLMCLGDIPLF